MTARAARHRERARKAPDEGASFDALSFRPVTKRNATDFEALFSAPGAPKYCWCMAWRLSAAEAKKNDPTNRKRQMLERIGRNVPVGLLAYDGKTPVAWASIAPRDTYRTLGGPEAKPGETIWSLACFFVPRRLRRQGMTRRLIAAAVDHARKKGATAVEAYPVEAGSPSYRFMGFVPIFEEAGFKEVGRAGSRRHVLRLELSERMANGE